ncbi:MAG: RIP metalloprotease RseP [Aerococcus sp.]|nr:RIP metalloprotease RseP [Aerococcus sp.]
MKAIIIFILIFGILVIFHEFGHFIMAKRAGIFVREFSIGMGPLLFHYEGDETTYSLRLLPLGGYVRMAGLEDNGEYFTPGQPIVVGFNEANEIDRLSFDEDEDITDGLPVEVVEGDMDQAFILKAIPYGEKEPVIYKISRHATIIEEDGNVVRVSPPERQFQSAKLSDRLLTNLAGPVQNFILGILAFILIAFMQGGVPSNSNVLGGVQENSPAQMAGLHAGDQIIAVNQKSVANFSEIQQEIQKYPNKQVSIKLADKRQLHVKPEPQKLSNGETIGLIGAQQTVDHGVWSKIKYGFTQAWMIITGVIGVIASMFKTGFDINDFGGPVYMYQATTQVADIGFTAILSLLAYLSINLGMVNLLPVPALDGGKVLLNLIESVRGKPLSPKTEGMINLAGAIGILILFVAVTWNDIMRFF